MKEFLRSPPAHVKRKPIVSTFRWILSEAGIRGSDKKDDIADNLEGSRCLQVTDNPPPDNLSQDNLSKPENLKSKWQQLLPLLVQLSVSLIGLYQHGHIMVGISYSGWGMPSEKNGKILKGQVPLPPPTVWKHPSHKRIYHFIFILGPKENFWFSPKC